MKEGLISSSPDTNKSCGSGAAGGDSSQINCGSPNTPETPVSENSNSSCTPLAETPSAVAERLVSS